MNYIFYFHLYNNVVEFKIKHIQKFFNIVSLETLLTNTQITEKNCCFFCDDCHISCTPLIQRPNFYFPYIGRVNNESTYIADKCDYDDITYTQKNSELGDFTEYIKLKDIPQDKILNHTYTHMKNKNGIPIHAANFEKSCYEILNISEYINHNVVQAPYNYLNNTFLSACKYMKVKYVIGNYVYELYNGEYRKLNIRRIIIEYKYGRTMESLYALK